MAKEKFYMTTAIAYTSGKPHIGNTYEVVLADMVSPISKRQQDTMYLFQTGMDEYGQKIGAGKPKKQASHLRRNM